MTKIHKDSHGLYVRAGGYVARPNAFEQVKYEALQLAKQDSKAPITVGMEVKARHLACSLWVKITLPDGTNVHWFAHGFSYAPGGKLADTNKVFRL